MVMWSFFISKPKEKPDNENIRYTRTRHFGFYVIEIIYSRKEKINGYFTLFSSQQSNNVLVSQSVSQSGRHTRLREETNVWSKEEIEKGREIGREKHTHFIYTLYFFFSRAIGKREEEIERKKEERLKKCSGVKTVNGSLYAEQQQLEHTRSTKHRLPTHSVSFQKGSLLYNSCFVDSFLQNTNERLNGTERNGTREFW